MLTATLNDAMLVFDVLFIDSLLGRGKGRLRAPKSWWWSIFFLFLKGFTRICKHASIISFFFFSCVSEAKQLQLNVVKMSSSRSATSTGTHRDAMNACLLDGSSSRSSRIMQCDHSETFKVRKNMFAFGCGGPWVRQRFRPFRTDVPRELQVTSEHRQIHMHHHCKRWMMLTCTSSQRRGVSGLSTEKEDTSYWREAGAPLLFSFLLCQTWKRWHAKQKNEKAAARLSRGAEASMQSEVDCGDLRNDSVVILAQTLASCVIHGAVPSGSYGCYLITMLMMFRRAALNCEHALPSLPLVLVLCGAALFLVVVPASPTDCTSPLPFNFLYTPLIWMHVTQMRDEEREKCCWRHRSTRLAL